ncbi:hypothetical protein N9L19_01285 [bacterium]|nr:hypothetical protein [bacterium]
MRTRSVRRSSQYSPRRWRRKMILKWARRRLTGHTVRAAKLHPEGNNIRVTWADLEAPRNTVGDHVILSRMHLYQYAFKHPLLVRLCMLIRLCMCRMAPRAIDLSEWTDE